MGPHGAVMRDGRGLLPAALLAAAIAAAATAAPAVATAATTAPAAAAPTTAAPAVAAPTGVVGPGIELAPDEIRIGTFFGGEDLAVSAEIPAGSEALVEVIGEVGEEQLLRKGHHWEIWMHVGEVDVEGAPTLYLARSTGPEAAAPEGSGPPCGYGALEAAVTFQGDTRGLEHLKLCDEFIKLKESEKLYGVHPGTLKLSPAARGRSLVEGTFRIPPKAPPGRYRVALSVFREGRLVESRSAAFGIRMVGLPATLSSLARRHGALYGLLAIGVAVVFGYLTGAVFRGRRGRR